MFDRTDFPLWRILILPARARSSLELRRCSESETESACKTETSPVTSHRCRDEMILGRSYSPSKIKDGPRSKMQLITSEPTLTLCTCPVVQQIGRCRSAASPERELNPNSPRGAVVIEHHCVWFPTSCAHDPDGTSQTCNAYMMDSRADKPPQRSAPGASSRSPPTLITSPIVGHFSRRTRSMPCFIVTVLMDSHMRPAARAERSYPPPDPEYLHVPTIRNQIRPHLVEHLVHVRDGEVQRRSSRGGAPALASKRRLLSNDVCGR